MRILHLGKYYAPQRGGIERHTQALAEACVRAGDAVAALVHQAPGHWRGSRETIVGVDVRRAGCIGAPVYTPLSPSFPFELAGALRDFAPDLLHLHLPNPSCFSALAMPAARRLPWIVHWHADVPPDAPDWRLRVGYRFYRPFEQAVLAHATTVIATSQPYFEASRALRPWRSKVRVVPIGIEAGPAAAPRTDLWPAAGGVRLLAVGRLGRYKGFDVLIEALHSTSDASLLLVGDGECAGELRALARSRGVEARVAFAGDVDDATLHAAYAGADAFVLPSLDRGEAFGLVLLEAMRVGLPVVASAIPGSGVGFVVAGNESGLLVEPGDPAALAAALARLRDPLLRTRLGEAGRGRWNALFTLEGCVESVRAIYAEASASAGARSRR
ncbi:MAG TPA: glycosyltransferase [Dokdonella sp.]|nr:glycosyltransferase [Dokdonella sp.]